MKLLKYWQQKKEKNYTCECSSVSYNVLQSDYSYINILRLQAPTYLLVSYYCTYCIHALPSNVYSAYNVSLLTLLVPALYILLFILHNVFISHCSHCLSWTIYLRYSYLGLPNAKLHFIVSTCTPCSDNKVELNLLLVGRGGAYFNDHTLLPLGSSIISQYSFVESYYRFSM